MEREIDPFASGSWEIWKPAVFEVELVGSSAVCLKKRRHPTVPSSLPCLECLCLIPRVPRRIRETHLNASYLRLISIVMM